jgi:triacylglycerol lipase
MRPPVLLTLALVVAVAAVAVVLARHTAGAPGQARGPVAAAVAAPVTTPVSAPVTAPATAPLRCATPAHPDPVVLVAGTFEATDWTSIADALTARGYCVKSFQYPQAGTGPIQQSAPDLATFVDGVLRSTGAKRVSIVAHSEGGVVARYYIRFQGGAAKVADLVALAPPNHGTTTPLIVPGVILGCVACAQQVAGSSLLAKLNAGNGLPGPVNYTVIETRYDLVVTPYQSAFLHGPANRLTNVLLQNACANDVATHLTITDDPVAVQWVQEALVGTGPANPAFQPRC